MKLRLQHESNLVKTIKSNFRNISVSPSVSLLSLHAPFTAPAHETFLLFFPFQNAES